jgi:hypothetical protein
MASVTRGRVNDLPVPPHPRPTPVPLGSAPLGSKPDTAEPLS